MGIFSTTPKKLSFSESVEKIAESRRQFVSMFQAVKEGLEQDNLENQNLQSEIELEINSLAENLKSLKEVNRRNTETILQVNKFIGL